MKDWMNELVQKQIIPGGEVDSHKSESQAKSSSNMKM